MICYDFFCSYKNSYFLFNRQELLEKAKDRNHNGGGKNETGKYYIENTDVVIVKANSKHKNLSEEKKEQKENIGEIGTKTWKKMKARRALKMKYCFFVYYENE